MQKSITNKLATNGFLSFTIVIHYHPPTKYGGRLYFQFVCLFTGEGEGGVPCHGGVPHPLPPSSQDRGTPPPSSPDRTEVPPHPARTGVPLPPSPRPRPRMIVRHRRYNSSIHTGRLSCLLSFQRNDNDSQCPFRLPSLAQLRYSNGKGTLRNSPRILITTQVLPLFKRPKCHSNFISMT